MSTQAPAPAADRPKLRKFAYRGDPLAEPPPPELAEIIDRHRGGALLRVPPLRPEHRAVVADALEAGGAHEAAARLRE